MNMLGDLLLQLLGLWLLGLFLFGLGLWINTFKYRHLPGDFGFPIIGQLYHCFRTIMGGSERIWKRSTEALEKHGEVVCIWNGPVILIAIGDPKLIQGLSFHPATVNKEWLLYGIWKPVLEGTFTRGESDAEWKYQRKQINRAMRQERLEAFHEIFARRSIELVNAMKEQKGEFNVHPFTFLHTIDILAATNFGLEFHELDNRNMGLYRDIASTIHAMEETLANPLLFLLSKPLLRYTVNTKKHALEFEKRYYNYLVNQAKMMKDDDEDLSQGAAILLNNSKNNVPLEKTFRELREIIMVGSDTTGVMLATALLFLAVHPDIQEKVWKEQEEIFQGSDRLPTVEDMKSMNYLKMVIKDAARFVAGPIQPRRCTEKMQQGKYTIPANSTILICSYKLRTDPRYWEKVAFCPENYSSENVCSRPKGVDMSFGLKPRTCPGAEYTIILGKIVISTVIRNLKLFSSLKPDELYDLSPHVVLLLKRPYLISCKPRTSSVGE